jgi:hypothetical protein
MIPWSKSEQFRKRKKIAVLLHVGSNFPCAFHKIKRKFGFSYTNNKEEEIVCYKLYLRRA